MPAKDQEPEPQISNSSENLWEEEEVRATYLTSSIMDFRVPAGRLKALEDLGGTCLLQSFTHKTMFLEISPVAVTQESSINNYL